MERQPSTNETDALTPPSKSNATPTTPAAGGLVFESLNLSLRSQTLLRDLSLNVAESEVVTVMGPSGAGKTTLLRAVAGMVKPTGGRIERPRGRLAMIFQDPRLLPWRSAIQNVEVVLDPTQRSQALRWLSRVGLADAANVYPSALSGGMRQRVAIARALATNASIVLVDEPFSSLDVATADQLRTDLTAHLRSGGHTVLWVTHDPEEAAAVGDRTLVMQGPPDGSWHITAQTTVVTEPSLNRSST